ncbi:hypothetical protein NQ314_018719 [Rhamnusium bicolor]|uniref:PiggyBac transposable element-derived protein domain-containing protein n=1 Tax=Rhamnusium bicolor TaxID=1586634 RepID=A0AAV8WQB1_9CUCU|nr:hypothetical protein NQ314_018719 [Rhamnusium bicolor]
MDNDEFQPVSTGSFYGKRYKTLSAAVDDIASSSSHNDADIVVIPPDVDVQTDEDEIDEDNCATSYLPNDVPGEIEVHYDDDEDILPLTELQKKLVCRPSKRAKTANTKEVEPKWTENILDLKMTESYGYIDRLNNLKIEMIDKTSVQSLFDTEIFEYIIEQTHLYAAQKNNHTFSLPVEDLKIFIGILLFSGYHKIPRERLYWSLDEDVSVPIVSNAMSRNRFQEIKKFLHFSDNTKLDKTDKMYKLRSLMQRLNKNFQKWGIFHQNLSIDEAMVKYFGHHSSKQFIRGKPVRFGYKDWMLCSSSGYCYKFDTYCGAKPMKDTDTHDRSKSSLSLGSLVVLDLLECVSQPSDHVLFFDNFFTSYHLMQTLRERGYRATGSVRENRTKKCPLPSVNAMKKDERGVFNYICDETSSVLFVRWKDNNVVTMATNYDTIEPLSKVKRWSSAKKEKIDVPQPQLFSKYNASMGGVDLLDQAVNNYRINIQGKKWWWPLFTHMLNVSVVNAWRIQNLSCEKNTDLLTFVRSIARHYLRCFEKIQYIEKAFWIRSN